MLAHIEVGDEGLPPTPQMEQERRVAIFDLMEANRFALVPEALGGPYRLRLAMEGRRLRFEVSLETGTPAAVFSLSLGPLEQTVKDYLAICDTYTGAIKALPPARIEAIDAARRDIHADAARQLRERLSDKVEMDEATAKRFFTLVCAMTSQG